MEHQHGEKSVQLQPSFHGNACRGNGLHEDTECLCEECSHFLVCFPDWQKENFYENLAKTLKE